MSKEIFLSVNLETGKAVQTAGELKQLIKDLNKLIDSKKLLDVDTQAAQAKLKLAREELNRFNQASQASPGFTKKMAQAIAEATGQMGLFNKATKGNHLIVIAALIASVIGYLKDLYEKSDKVRIVISGLWEAAKTAFIGIKDLAVQYLGGVGNIIAGIFTRDAEQIKKGFNQIADLPKQAVSEFKKVGDAYQKGVEARTSLENNSIQGLKAKIEVLEKEREKIDSSTEAGLKKIEKLNKQIEDAKKRIAKLDGTEAKNDNKEAARLAEEQRKLDEKNAKEVFDRQQELNRKAAEDLANIQDSQRAENLNKDIEALYKAYKEKGDFSKAAEKKLQDDLLNLKIQALEDEKKYNEDNKPKLASIDVEIAKLKADAQKKEAEDVQKTAEEKVRAEEESQKKRTEAAKKAAEDRQKIEEQATQQITQTFAEYLNGLIQLSFQSEQQRAQEKLTRITDTLNAEIEALDIAQAKEEGTYVEKTATEKKFDAERKKLRDKAAAEEKKIKTDAFKKEKAAKVIESIIATALGVAKAIPNIPLMIAAGIAGAASTALISAQPVPQFATGQININGPGTATSDSIPAMISNGESVINARGTQMFGGLLQRINDIGNGYIPEGRAVVNSNIAAFAAGYVPQSTNSSIDMAQLLAEQRAFFSLELSKERTAKVYEGDMTSVQNRNRKIENRALFNAA